MFAYHATTPRTLRRISEDGLVPRTQAAQHADENRAVDDPVVFFTPSAELAAVWGPIVLRFPWPDESYEDWYGDTVIVNGKLVRSQWFTYDRVPPDEIEIRVGAAWCPLVPRTARAMCVRANRR